MEDHFNTLYSWRIVLDNAVHFCRDSLIQPRSQIQTTKKPNCQVNKMECSSTTITISPCNRWPIHTITGSQPLNTTRCIMGSRITSNRALPSNKGYQSHHVSSWQNLPNQTVYLLRPNYMILHIMLLLNPKSRIPHLPPLPRTHRHWKGSDKKPVRRS